MAFKTPSPRIFVDLLFRFFLGTAHYPIQVNGFLTVQKQSGQWRGPGEGVVGGGVWRVPALARGLLRRVQCPCVPVSSR